MHSNRARFALAFALPVFTCVAACGGGGGGGGGPADAAGSITFEPGGVMPVLEPNDSVDQPQDLGVVRAGMSFELDDALDPRTDALDGFRVHTRGPVRLAVQLVRLRGAGLPPEILVYDPVAMRPASVTSSGSVTLLADGVVDVVVRATDAACEYSLRIAARRPTDASAGPRDVVQVSAESAFAVTARPHEQRIPVTAREALALELATLPGASVIDRASGAQLAPNADGRVQLDALAAVELVVPAESTARRVSLATHTLVEGAPSPGSQLAPNAGSQLAPNAGSQNAPSTAPRRAAITPTLPALALEAARDANAVWGRTRLRAVPGELLVKSRDAQDLTSRLAARGLTEVDAIPGDARVLRFDVPANAVDAERVAVALCASLGADPDVEWAERNLVRTASGGVTPNDTFFPLQWDFPLLHLPDAWSITTGDNAVIVAVIDTGETTHPELTARQIAGYDFISSAANAADGDGRDADPTDVGDGDGVHPSSFHGTHVAGTIGASTNNATGVAGVMWAGKIMHLRVLGVDGGTDADIANAIRYAARLANASGTLPAVRANVINMSLGGPGSSSTVQSAVTAARGQGVVIFAAAGNENSSVRSYPASYTGVISVAAVDINANRAPYSNFGTTIDLAAPGGDTSGDLDDDGFVDGVLSTLFTDSMMPIFAFYQGTSMACPHAAGVAALMLAVDPTLTPDEIETILTNTATDLGTAGRDDLYGNGLIHAERAVMEAAGIAVGPNPVLALSPQAIAFGVLNSTIPVGVANAGSGLLDVDTLTIATNDGMNWLSATPVAILTPVSSDTSAISVHVDRTGLADGNYAGSVTVASNGGVQVITVAMTVDAASVPVNIDLFVLAVDADTLETVAQVVVNPTTGLDYAFTDLPAGDYVIIAGSDDDNDDQICGAGDLYCGLYPTLNEPEIVSVSGSDLAGLDFTITNNVSALTGFAARKLHVAR